MEKKNLKTGDIINCKSNSWLSRAIRKVTKSRYSHTATCILIDGDMLIAESQHNGTTLSTYEDWQEKYGYEYDVFRRYNLNEDAFRKKVMDITNKKIGYDFVSLLWRYPWFIVTGKWAPNFKNSDKRLYCSEFVALVQGMPSPYKMSPQDIFEYCSKNNSIFEYIK